MIANDNTDISGICAESRDDRTITLVGEEAFDRLRNANVLIVGLGGVGGYAAETLLRSGIGKMTLLDADVVAPSNLNRQLIALESTIGKPKATVMAQRFHDINPDAILRPLCMRLTTDNVESLITSENYDFVVDAIDTVAPKVELIAYCLRNRVPIISSMGAGGRTDPTKIGYFDLWNTRDDGLARAVRQRLKKAGILRKLCVVASAEPPHRHALLEVKSENKRSSYGTLATIPAIFGLFMANHVICKIAKL